MTTQLTDPPALWIQSVLLRPPGLALVRPRTGPGEHDHIVRVQVGGELDFATAPALTAELAAVARGHALRASWAANPAIELNLSRLSFLDSHAATTLAHSRAALQELGCGLCLTFPRPAVLRLLHCAVCNGWLPPDVECAGYHPWPSVTRPIRAGARPPRGRGTHGRVLGFLPGGFP